MEGSYSAGEYKLPNGEMVRVFRTYNGAWGCVIVSPDGSRLTATAVTPELWAQLEPRPESPE